MNSYENTARRRGRTLLIVEGKHEKNALFWLLFKCFPEMNIDMDTDNVWVYGTNIYMYIWVLNTSVLIVAEYNFSLIEC